MVSLIRNQVLKHLSKFTKNLSIENIQLSALKGRCELHNLDLNEDLLMELLELPSWLSLTRAYCNSAVLKVPWTKLKSEPIVITLDCVDIHIETCEQLRNISHSQKPSYTSGKYGFAEQTLDSLTLVVNSVQIHFKSPVFEATLDLQRLVVESRTPNWQKADLRQCRLKNRDSNDLLLFKQIEWQTLRIEAKVASAPSTPLANLSPLRLLTNSAKCRLTLKKKLADCSLITSRLFVVFDNLLWVLTDAQMVAALHFANSLSDLIDKATELSHKVQATKHLALPMENVMNNVTRKETALTAVWRAYDIAETSYHIFCTLIDLHLVDETSIGAQCRSGLPELEKGGCMQITLKNLQVDHYPFHRANAGRDHWLRYTEPSGDRQPWLEQMHLTYAIKNNMNGLREGEYQLPSHLMCSTSLLIIENYTIYKVSTSSRAERQPFLTNYHVTSEKAVFLDFTDYYYPGKMNTTEPPPSYFYGNVGPSLIRLDVPTILWTHAFCRSLIRENLFKFGRNNTPIPNCRFEFYLAKVVFDEVVSQCSRIIMSNSREGDTSSRADLKQCLDSFSRGPLFFETSKYPWMDSDVPPSSRGAPAISQTFVNHCISDDVPAEVWSICFDPLWMDFVEKGRRTETIVDPLPITLWICEGQTLAHIKGLINVQLCHSQYPKFLKKMSLIKDLVDQLKKDILNNQMFSSTSDMMLAGMLPCIYLSLILKNDASFKMSNNKDNGYNSDESRTDSPPTISSCSSVPRLEQVPEGPFGVEENAALNHHDNLSMLTEDSMDAMSMRSDESDSLTEKLAHMLTKSQKPGEELLAGVELAVEAAEEAREAATDDYEDQISHESDTVMLISVVTLKIRDIQTVCTSDYVLYQMHSIEFDEKNAIEKEVFLGEFSARTRTAAGQNGVLKQKSATCLTSGRLDLNDILQLQLLIQGLEVKLSSGSLAGLADMFGSPENTEASPIPPPQPLVNGQPKATLETVVSTKTAIVTRSRTAFSQLPLAIRILLYDVKLRILSDDVVVVPHCLIDRPIQPGRSLPPEAAVFILPIGFSTLDESVDKLLREYVPVDKLPVTDVSELASESGYVHLLMGRVQTAETENHSLRSLNKQQKKDLEKLSVENCTLRKEIDRLERQLATPNSSLQHPLL